MAKKIPLRFKKNPREKGLAGRVQGPRGCAIIINNKESGSISAVVEGWRWVPNKWETRIRVPREPDENCSSLWDWRVVQATNGTLEDAQLFVRENIEKIYEIVYKGD